MGETQEPTVEQLETALNGKQAIIEALEQQRNSALNEAAVARANLQILVTDLRKKLKETSDAVEAARAEIAMLRAAQAGAQLPTTEA